MPQKKKCKAIEKDVRCQPLASTRTCTHRHTHEQICAHIRTHSLTPGSIPGCVFLDHLPKFWASQQETVRVQMEVPLCRELLGRSFSVPQNLVGTGCCVLTLTTSDALHPLRSSSLSRDGIKIVPHPCQASLPFSLAVPSFMCLSWSFQASSSLAVCLRSTRTQTGNPGPSMLLGYRGHL